jgi:hypothetical protein
MIFSEETKFYEDRFNKIMKAMIFFNEIVEVFLLNKDCTYLRRERKLI